MENNRLTIFAFALLDQVLVFDVFVTCFAVEPGSEITTQTLIILAFSINKSWPINFWQACNSVFS